MTLYSTFQRDIKSSIAKRAIRTIRGVIFKYLSSVNSFRYVDAIPQIQNTYNLTTHSSLGKNTTPHQVHHLTNNAAIREQFRKMYIKHPRARRNPSVFDKTLSKGDTVRILSSDRTSRFTKAALPKNTLEVFRIRRVNRDDVGDKHYPVPVYYLEDLSGEHIMRLFYGPELITVTLPEYYPIDV